jgi:hypothetical protein
MKRYINFPTFLVVFAVVACCEQTVFGTNELSDFFKPEFSISITNDSGIEAATIKMPTNAALRLLQTLYWINDQSIREQALTNGIMKITQQSRAEAVAALESNGAHTNPKAAHGVKGMIDHGFADHYGKERHYLYIRLPKAEALALLIAALDVGDPQFRYQVMEFGLRNYKDTGAQEYVLSELLKSFDSQELSDQGDILRIAVNISLTSSNTIEILRKGMAVKGDDRLPTVVRKLAKDLEQYRQTGDPKLLEPYNVRMP